VRLYKTYQYFVHDIVEILASFKTYVAEVLEK
jgi:hypothetical protein